MRHAMLTPLVDFPLSPKQRQVQDLVRGLADSTFRERAGRWDEREEYPWDNIKDLVAHGLMGMTLPVEYGGRGASVLEAVLAIEAPARACGVTGRILVDSNFGAVGAIAHRKRRGRARSHQRASGHGHWISSIWVPRTCTRSPTTNSGS